MIDELAVLGVIESMAEHDILFFTLMEMLLEKKIIDISEFEHKKKENRNADKLNGALGQIYKKHKELKEIIESNKRANEWAEEFLEKFKKIKMHLKENA